LRNCVTAQEKRERSDARIVDRGKVSRVFASWSGGKDSALACYRGIDSGLEVRCLLNMATESGERSRTHGLSTAVLQVQAQAIGLPLVRRNATWESYETEFKNVLRALRREGIEGGIFGDIDLDEHRQWIERVCGEAGITPYLPLWGERQEEIMRDFINLGFEAAVVTARAELMGEEWLGRKIDLEFLKKLEEADGITPCGEAGEYHTFVTDGPLFKQRVAILEAQKVLREEYWFWEILDCVLTAKAGAA